MKILLIGLVLTLGSVSIAETSNCKLKARWQTDAMVDIFPFNDKIEKHYSANNLLECIGHAKELLSEAKITNPRDLGNGGDRVQVVSYIKKVNVIYEGDGSDSYKVTLERN